MFSVDLPLTPFFFHKLGIYQELTDPKLTKEKDLWPIERDLLMWTVKGHQHLSSPVSQDFAIHNLVEVVKSKAFLQVEESTRKQVIGIVLGNLCQRGCATKIERDYILDDPDASRVCITTNEGHQIRLHREVVRIADMAVGAPVEIVFTPKGLSAGRVLSDMENGGEWKYIWTIRIVWFVLAVLFVQIIIMPFLKDFGLQDYWIEVVLLICISLLVMENKNKLA